MFRALLEGCAFAMRDVVDRLDRIGVAGASLLLLGGGTGAGKGRQIAACILDSWLQGRRRNIRSEEHTSELQSLMRISYAVFCLKQNTQHTSETPGNQSN